jgi:hypothetical protein
MTDDTRLGPPPVEPMPDVAWARVERGLWRQLDASPEPARPATRRRTWLWLAAPLVATAAIATVVVVVRDTSTPVAQVADEPTRVVTDSAPSSISLGDAHIALDAHSAITSSQPATVTLETGGAWFSVAPRGDRPPFVVIAGDTRVQVIGTRFRVTRAGEHTDVAVDHGIVEVRHHGTVQRLTAGQTWSSDEVAIEIDPATPAPPQAPVKPHHSAAPASQTPVPLASPSDPDATRFAALTKLEASQPAIAMKGYLELSQGSGKWAEVSLFAAARLAVDTHDARAETLLTIYLRRFPSGANTDDAHALLTRMKGTHP